jgi:hypothetical protein
LSEREEEHKEYLDKRDELTRMINGLKDAKELIAELKGQ